MDLKPHRPAIEKLRQLTDAYVAGEIELAAFYDAFKVLAQTLFELSPDLNKLPASLTAEISHYLRWEGFGPWAGHVPGNPDWVYGKNDEPYGWIDQSRFRQKFMLEHAKIDRMAI